MDEKLKSTLSGSLSSAIVHPGALAREGSRDKRSLMGEAHVDLVHLGDTANSRWVLFIKSNMFILVLLNSFLFWVYQLLPFG